MKTLQHKATLLALGTAVISGVSIFINKFAVGTLSDPVVFAGLKNAVVAVLLVGVLLAVGKHAEVRTLTKRQWVQLAVIGLIGGAIPFALFFTGLALIPAATGAMLHKTLFVWVAILAVLFLKEKPSPLQWLGVSLLLASNIFIGGFQGFAYNMGELLVLGATLLWAVENVLAKKALVNISSVVVASGRMVFGSLFLFAFLGITGRAEALTTLSMTGLWWTLLTSVLLMAYVLTWYTALKYAPASYVAALLVPATLVTNLLSAVFVTGALTSAQALSGVLVLIGSVFIIVFARHVHSLQNNTGLVEPSPVR